MALPHLKKFCDYAPETHALSFLTHIILAISGVKDKACHKAHNAISTRVSIFPGLFQFSSPGPVPGPSVTLGPVLSRPETDLLETLISTSHTIDLFLGVGNTLVPSIGTQINIENLNIDMSSKTLLDHEDGGQCLVIDQREIKAEQDLVLGKVLYHKYYINYEHKMSFFSALDYFDSKKYTLKPKLTVFSLFCADPTKTLIQFSFYPYKYEKKSLKSRIAEFFQYCLTDQSAQNSKKARFI